MSFAKNYMTIKQMLGLLIFQAPCGVLQMWQQDSRPPYFFTASSIVTVFDSEMSSATVLTQKHNLPCALALT